MQVSTAEFRKGLKIELDGQPYNIVEFQHVKPGKGGAGEPGQQPSTSAMHHRRRVDQRILTATESCRLRPLRREAVHPRHRAE
jgi:Translation elongation factor P (EF-P)/translation initiation factor 5A (eIF-5A)